MKENCETMSGVNVDFIRFNPQQPISSYLKPDIKFKISLTHQNYQSMEVGRAKIDLLSHYGALLTSTPKHQSILGEFRASFCYILLTISDANKALMLHDYSNKQITVFGKNLDKLKGKDSITFVGGMTKRGEDEQKTMKSITELLGDKTQIYRLLINDLAQPVTVSLADNNPYDFAYHGLSGMIYIPPSFSVNNKNTVFCVSNDFDESDQASRMLMSCGSKWEHFDVAVK